MPSALRKGLSAIYGAGKGVTAEATRRSSLSRISFDRDVFFCNVGLCIDPHLARGEACFRFHAPFVPTCFVRPLGCFAVDFGQIPFHIVFAKKAIENGNRVFYVQFLQPISLKESRKVPSVFALFMNIAVKKMHIGSGAGNDACE